jgi:hypothetical protein
VAQFVHEGIFAPEERVTTAAGTMLGQLRRWALALKPLRSGEL